MYLKIIAGVVAFSVLSGLAYDYRNRLIAQGEQQCADRVDAAKKDLQGQTKTIVIDHSAADKARIAELEAANKKLTDETSKRGQHREAVSIGEACDKCMIPRNWLRGGTQ